MPHDHEQVALSCQRRRRLSFPHQRIVGLAILQLGKENGGGALVILDKFCLAGQIGVVTGGGQGLDKVFCHAFAEAGADLVVTEINPETGPVTVAEIQARGRRALFIETDVRQRASVQTMVDRAVAEFGRIDFLMNNAGIVIWAEAENVTEEDWRDVIDVNLNGLFFCCQAVGRHMIERRQGCINYHTPERFGRLRFSDGTV